MNSQNATLIKIETLKNLMVSYSTGPQTKEDEEQYANLRRELIADPLIQEYLPRFLISCRTAKEFWSYISSKFAKYAERREFLRNEFDPVLTFLETGVGGKGSSDVVRDRFKFQFPAGLPFGLIKPNLAFVPEKGTQVPRFESALNIGVIRDSVYPSLDFNGLWNTLNGQPIAASLALFRKHLLGSSQTDKEKKLLYEYSKTFGMELANIPVLIPQAWIQWHSTTKNNLRSQQSSYADDLYRVDFVAFWKNKRFAILVDDISHYGKKIGERWDADELAYSKRLKEDRKLRREDWNVFRVSNWEMREENYIPDILSDLQQFIDF